MRALQSPCKRRQCEPGARRTGPLREHVPLCRLERIERGETAAREQPDAPPDASADAVLQHSSRGEQSACASGLEAEQLQQLWGRAIERGHAEATPVLGREIDPAELEIARNVLQEVDELQTGADVVARGDQARVAVE